MPKKNTERNLLKAYAAAQDKKALDIVMLDLRVYQGITDYFLICSGTSSRHTQAICDGITEKLERKSPDAAIRGTPHPKAPEGSVGEKGVVFRGVEGYNNASWILIDCVDFVIHIFKEETRELYNLEGLWGDAKEIGKLED